MKRILYTILTLLFITSGIYAKRVLFVGDSVTDGGWGNSAGQATPTAERNQWDQNHIFGHSYMMLCAAHFLAANPENDLEFFNRGISGDDLQRIEDRWQEDVISMNPDIVSLLVGTNDIHYYLEKKESAFDYQQWEQRYRHLLDELRSANPKVKIILGTPFVARVGRIGESEDFALREEMVHRLADIVEKIAKDYGAILLRYDTLFASQKQIHPTVPMKHWIWDGIHPTAAGHQLMVDLWIGQSGSIIVD